MSGFTLFNSKLPWKTVCAISIIQIRRFGTIVLLIFITEIHVSGVSGRSLDTISAVPDSNSITFIEITPGIQKSTVNSYEPVKAGPLSDKGTCSSSSRNSSVNCAVEWNSRYINITEASFGIGLGDVSVKKSKYHYGITSLFAYPVDDHFLLGIGAGTFIYDNAFNLPLFLEVRYNINLEKYIPYISACGGFLFNNCGIKNFGFFINPGIGIAKKITKTLLLNFGTGVSLQDQRLPYRTSFLNFKLGFTFLGK
jgi:hypothetical protein